MKSTKKIKVVPSCYGLEVSSRARPCTKLLSTITRIATASTTAANKAASAGAVKHGERRFKREEHV